jgi:TolB-like protein/DNA-binding winged helix-turn-helix (wHTH) protein/Tfp pilus assembly protein PilF
MTTTSFGPYQFDLQSGQLRRSGALLKLQPQPARLLALLVSRSGELVTRDEIRKELWNAETFVDFDQSVNFCIRQIRAVLSDDAENPCYVETVPRHGYRFIAPVQVSTAGSPDQDIATRPVPLPSRPLSRPWIVRTSVVLVAIFVTLAIVAAIHSRRNQSAPSSNTVGLAVLPFASLDGEPYFADGITEEVITELARLRTRQLRVIARTSVMAYKETNKAPSQIGRELGVAYVLMGSVRRSEGKLRIAVQLVSTADNRYVWAQSYDRPLADALDVQRELARSVAAQTRLTVTSEESQQPKPARPVDPAVYEQVLMGRYFLSRTTRQDSMKAIELFQAAVSKDPNYAAGYAGLADAYNRLGSVFLAGKPPADARLAAIRAATRATQLDSELAEAYAALGYTNLHELDWPQAENALRLALHLNPNYAPAHVTYASYLVARGQRSDAVEEARLALALDPVSLEARHTLAWMLYFNRDYDAAIQELQTTLQMDPSYAFGRWRLGQVEIVARRFDDAARELERAAIDGQRAPAILGLLAMAYGEQGRRPAAQRLVDELKARSASETVPPGAIALAYIGVGDTTNAIASLQEVYASRDNYAIYINVDPLMDPLRTDPRFQALSRRLDSGANATP